MASAGSLTTGSFSVNGGDLLVAFGITADQSKSETIAGGSLMGSGCVSEIVCAADLQRAPVRACWFRSERRWPP